MAYNQKRLDAYRQLIAEGKPFKSLTCPYCNGQRDATVKHIHPSTKPADPWAFWKDVLIDKYAALQSASARHNLSTTTHLSGHTENTKKDTATTESVESPDEHSDGKKSSSSGCPRMFVVGPMVDQSELPFRMLCRQYGATLAYTPMLHAKSFAEGAPYRAHFLTTTPPEEVKAAMEKAEAEASTTATSLRDEKTVHRGAEGDAASLADSQLVDRPCIVQFCGHEADTVLAAARYAVLGEAAGGSASASSAAHPSYPVRVQRRAPLGAAGTDAGMQEHLLYQCDAVDLNLGCPQGIARRGHYGSFLMEDWEVIHTIIHTLHVELEVPVTVKIRVFDHPGCQQNETAGCDGNDDDADAAQTPLKSDFDEALTTLYARMIRDAGAQVLCIHGRTRDMKGQLTSVANMGLIGRVRRALHGSIPVISNGNVYTYADVLRHLRETQCEGHMCAEPLLWDPVLFSNPPLPVMPGRTHGANKATRLAALHTARVYAAWVRRYPVDIGFVKAHLFKMCFHSYEVHTELRDVLGQLKTNVGSMKEVACEADDDDDNNAAAAAAEEEDHDTKRKGERQEKKEASPLAALKRTALSAASVSGEAHTSRGIHNKEKCAQEGESADSAAPGSSASAFEQYMDALDAHLLALIDAEQRCTVEGEQPKTAQAEKAKAREEIVDVWEEEGGLGIGF